MNDTKNIYWKKKPGAAGLYQGGFEPDGAHPEYGEVGETPLPETAEITRSAKDDFDIITFPPVIGPSFAYRYQLHLTSKLRENIRQASKADLVQMFSNANSQFIQRTRSKQTGAKTENWWWYRKDKFQNLTDRETAPYFLPKKWKSALMEYALKDHPLKDQMLSEWEEYKSLRKSGAFQTSPKKKNIKKTPGDIVINPRPTTFGVKARQIYQYDVESFNEKRNKYGLYANNDWHDTPHNEALPLSKLDLNDENYKPTIRASACLIMWKSAPNGTAHEVVASAAKYEGLFRSLLVLARDYLESEVEESTAGLAIHAKYAHVDAAKSALTDFAYGSELTPTPILQVADDMLQKHIFDYEKMLYGSILKLSRAIDQR